MQGCGSSSALAMELLQSCTEPSKFGCIKAYIYTYMFMPISYVYMCEKVYEDLYVYNVGRVVHLFLYMRNILLIVFILYFYGNLLSETYTCQ